MDIEAPQGPVASQSIGTTMKRQALSPAPASGAPSRTPLFENHLPEKRRFVQKYWATNAQIGDKRSEFR
jgi:hypothetical protein